MKQTQAFKWIFVFVAGVILSGCGGSGEDMSVLGPKPAAHLGKLATPQERARAGVSVLVWNLADGRFVAGAEVAFSRSISGVRLDYQWSATSDADGIAQLELVETTPNGKRGASGYYRARATDPETGEVLGTWGSIPIIGGNEYVISLPIGGRRTVVSGSGPLDATGLGRWTWSGPISGLPGSLETVYAGVMQRNTNGKAWGLIVGYQVLKDVNLGTGEPAPGLVLTFPTESNFACWDPTGEGDSFQFKFGFTKSPAAPFLIELQSIGRVTAPGDGSQPRIVYVGANTVAPGEFESVSCGDDYSPIISDAIAAGNAIEYDFGGSFRITHPSN